MKTGSIKLRRVRGGVNIRATGDVAELLAVSLSGLTHRALEQRRLRVRFVDEGQGMLVWEVSAEGRITACPGGDAKLIGAQLRATPTPGHKPLFSFPRHQHLLHCDWTVESVELLP